MPSWPSTIRPPLAEGFSETPAESVVESQADTGAGKSRLRSAAIKSTITLTYQMTLTEFAAFKTFYQTDIARGVLSFDWVHPITGDTERVRITGKYTAAAKGSMLQRVSFTIKVLR